MEKYYQRMLKDSDERVVKALQRQILDERNSRFGGFTDANGMVQAKNSIYETAAMIVAYCNEDSRYYHNETVLDRILLGLKYVRSVQHENGLFDYVTCNFFSAPEAFRKKALRKGNVLFGWLCMKLSAADVLDC